MNAFYSPVFAVDVPPIGKFLCPVCTKSEWDKTTLALALKRSDVLYEAALGICDKVPQSLPKTSCAAFLTGYRAAVEDYCKDNTDLYTIPSKPDFEHDEKDIRLPCPTYFERLVHEHTGYTFGEIGNLTILDYRLYLADAVKIRILQRSDGKGIEYLNECYDYMHGVSDIFG